MSMGWFGRMSGVVLAATALGACGGQAEEVEQPQRLLEPGVAGDQLVLVDQERSRAWWLGVGEEKPAARARAEGLPRAPALLTGRNGQEELLVLCQRPVQVEDGAPGALVVLAADGVERSYELGTRYGRVIQSEDGQYAFLFAGTDEAGGGLLSNLNDVSIIDLEQKPGERNPSQRTLSSLGESPNGVFVSPVMRLVEEDRRLAVVLFDTSLSVLDLNHLDRPEWAATLATSVGLQKAVFSPAQSRIYLRSQSAQDVYVLQLGPREEPQAGQNDFLPSLNQLGAGQAITDIALFQRGSAELLLATTVGSQLLVIDAGSSTVTPVGLAAPASTIHLFEVGASEEGEGSQQALLYAHERDLVTFVNLANLQERKERNLESINLPGTIESVTQLSKNRLLVTHSGTGLSVLDLNRRTITRIASEVSLTGAQLYDEALERVWLVPAGQERVGYLDLEGLQPREVQLDAAVQTAALVQGAAQPKLVVTHDSSLGYVTMVDASEPSRRSAVSLRGFLFDGVLDRGED
jgi:hypothetical protein